MNMQDAHLRPSSGNARMAVRQRRNPPFLRNGCGSDPCPRVALVTVLVSVARTSARHEGASYAENTVPIPESAHQPEALGLADAYAVPRDIHRMW